MLPDALVQYFSVVILRLRLIAIISILLFQFTQHLIYIERLIRYKYIFGLVRLKFKFLSKKNWRLCLFFCWMLENYFTLIFLITFNQNYCPNFFCFTLMEEKKHKNPKSEMFFLFLLNLSVPIENQLLQHPSDQI